MFDHISNFVLKQNFKPTVYIVLVSVLLSCSSTEKYERDDYADRGGSIDDDFSIFGDSGVTKRDKKRKIQEAELNYQPSDVSDLLKNEDEQIPTEVSEAIEKNKKDNELESLPSTPIEEQQVPTVPEKSSDQILREAALAAQAVPGQSSVDTPMVWYVGYDYQETKSKVQVQLITKGKPDFDFLLEKNQKDQPEIIVRFFTSILRPKLRRDIDASEFRSPVAYIRTRPFDQNATDVILTLREDVSPRVYAKDGNILLTFALSDKYKAPKEAQKTPIDKAEKLASANIVPEIEEGSELPASARKGDVVPNPAAAAFEDAPANGGEVLDTSTTTDTPQVQVPAVESQYINSTNTNHGLENELEKASRKNLSPNSTKSNGNAAPKDNRNNTNTNQNPNSPYNNNNQSNTINETKYDLKIESKITVTDFSFFDVASEPASENPMADQSMNGPTATTQQSTLPATPASTEAPESPVVEEPSAEPSEMQANVQAEINGQTAPSGGKYVGKPIRIEFYKAPLRQVLRAFVDQSGTNFIYPDAVGDIPVTIRLENVPWDAALNAILETNHLAMTRVGENVIRIDRIQDMKSYLTNRIEAKSAKLMAENTKALVVRISNAKAEVLQKKLYEILGLKLLGESAKITADERTNTLVIEAPEPVLARAKVLIEKLDVPIPQVEIASRIVEVTRNVANFLGISWTGALISDPNRGLGFGSLIFPNSMSSNYSIDPGVANSSSVGSANLYLGSLNDTIDLDLRLRMEESRGTTEILQSNKIVVNDREEAKINVTTVDYFKSPSDPTVLAGARKGIKPPDDGKPNQEQMSYQMLLGVTPEVTTDGKVNMRLQLKSETPSVPAAAGRINPAKTVRELNTTLLKRSGETTVIGGLYDNKKKKQIVGIPFLSYLPIIGALFRTTTTSESQTELMVMITPTIKPVENVKLPTESAEIRKNVARVVNPAIEEQSSEENENGFVGNNSQQAAENNNSNVSQGNHNTGNAYNNNSANSNNVQATSNNPNNENRNVNTQSQNANEPNNEN